MSACLLIIKSLVHKLLKDFMLFIPFTRYENRETSDDLKYYPKLIALQCNVSKLHIKYLMENSGKNYYFIKDKFSKISPKYDFLNTLFSFNIDSYWRKVIAGELNVHEGEAILDLCAGTMSLSRQLGKGGLRKIVALDFCHEMLFLGKEKLKPDNGESVIFPVCGDGTKMPLKSGCFLGVTVAFGLRNICNHENALLEIHRVLKPNGKLIILEFSKPSNSVVKLFYNFYLNKIMPFIGGLVSGDKEAYKYLASSIEGFHKPDVLVNMLKKAGFVDVSCSSLSFGIVTVYSANKDI